MESGSQLRRLGLAGLVAMCAASVVVLGLLAMLSPGRVAANAKAAAASALRREPAPVGLAVDSQAARESAMASEEAYIGALGAYETGKAGLGAAEAAAGEVSAAAVSAERSVSQGGGAAWQAGPERSLLHALQAVAAAASAAASAGGRGAFLADVPAVLSAFDRLAVVPEAPIALPGGAP